MTYQIITVKRAKQLLSVLSKSKIDQYIHDIGVCGLDQIQHGNFDILNSLVHAMPKSARGNALKYWITKHCTNIKWDATAGVDKRGGYVKKAKGQNCEVDIEGAIAHPFYEKPESEPSVFNPETRVMSLVNAFKKALSEGQIGAEDAQKARAMFDEKMDELVA